MPDLPEIDLDSLTAALRADSRDLAVFAHVLTANLADALPPGSVDVDRERSLSDRLAGREGSVTAIRVHLDDEVLELEPVKGRVPRARVIAQSGGVVISRREVGIEAWARLLAEKVAEAARQSESARVALARLLGL
ncbi:hypothetical protein JCM18899A_41800 [Nocardioides sp. AN3]